MLATEQPVGYCFANGWKTAGIRLQANAGEARKSTCESFGKQRDGRKAER
jgi:hypothetical protein